MHFFSLAFFRPLGVLTGLLLAFVLAANAQPGSGGPGPGTGPIDTPLDGGASLLLAGGVAYGLRLLRRKPRPM